MKRHRHHTARSTFVFARLTLGLTLGLTLAFVWATPVVAQHAGAFSRIGFDARGMSLGNALTADVFGDAGVYYNPALAPYQTGQNLQATAAIMRFDREFQSLQIGAPLKPRAGAAAALIHAGVSNIDGRDNSGFPTGELATDEFAFFFGFGIRVTNKASVGVTLQLYRTDLLQEVDPVRSVGVDLGFAYRVSDQLSFGVVVDDLLAKYDWDTSSSFAGGGTTVDRFPRRLRFGGMYGLSGRPVRLYGEYEVSFTKTDFRTLEVEVRSGTPVQLIRENEITVSDSEVRFGAEYRLPGSFAVRAGAHHQTDEAFGGVRPSAGFAIEQPVGGLGARVDYAFILEPYGSGAVHVLSVRIFL